MKTLILTKNEIGNLLTMQDAIHSAEQAYKIYSKNMLEQPSITSIDIPEHNGEVDIKSCYSKTDDMISIKSASGYWNNMERYTLPTLMATIILLDGKTGYPLCIMDGSLITNYRTGAAGGLSSKLLARSDSKKIGVIGAGNQARMQVKAIKEVLPIEQVKVWAPSVDGMQKYKASIEEELELNVELCKTSEDAILGADIVVTATPGKNHVIQSQWIEEGMHIIAVGADMEGKQELDPKIFSRSKVFVDSIEQCLERGETRNAVISRNIDPRDIHGELGEVLLNVKSGRESEKEVTIFDTTGMGIQDNTLAALLYKKARESEIGTEIDFLGL